MAIILGLLSITITIGLTESNQLSQVNTLQTQLSALQASNNQLQTNYANLQAQYNQLNSQYQQLKSAPNTNSTSNSQISELQSQLTNLESQLANATALIDKLQGPTGILPVSMDLGLVGPLDNGNFILALSLKNTGTLPITQIFVTCNSQQFTIPFTYLNNSVCLNNPLPPYQIATGTQDVTPPVGHVGTYPLIIQALASDGTVYTYQTTISSHV